MLANRGSETETNCYAILGILPTATEREIGSRFRLLVNALKLHPDKQNAHTEQVESEQTKAAVSFQNLLEARDIALKRLRNNARVQTNVDYILDDDQKKLWSKFESAIDTNLNELMRFDNNTNLRPLSDIINQFKFDALVLKDFGKTKESIAKDLQILTDRLKIQTEKIVLVNDLKPWQKAVIAGVFMGVMLAALVLASAWAFPLVIGFGTTACAVLGGTLPPIGSLAFGALCFFGSKKAMKTLTSATEGSVNAGETLIESLSPKPSRIA